MEKRLKLFIALFACLGLLSCTKGGRESGRGKSITVKGSDTMVILGQRWAENYMKGHPDIIVQV
ncbi:MAG: hypothetical protein AB1633_13560, partial [Elusimicrobiota bacterium]